MCACACVGGGVYQENTRDQSIRFSRFWHIRDDLIQESVNSRENKGLCQSIWIMGILKNTLA